MGKELQVTAPDAHHTSGCIQRRGEARLSLEPCLPFPLLQTPWSTIPETRLGQGAFLPPSSAPGSLLLEHLQPDLHEVGALSSEPQLSPLLQGAPVLIPAATAPTLSLCPLSALICCSLHSAGRHWKQSLLHMGYLTASEARAHLSRPCQSPASALPRKACWMND